MENAFKDKTINFATDEMQEEMGTPADQQLKLCSFVGHMDFLQPSVKSIKPDSDSDHLPNFPFNGNGNMRDAFTKDTNVYLFSKPSFGAKTGKTCSTCDMLDPETINKDFREDGMYDQIYDGTQVEWGELESLYQAFCGRNQKKV